MKRILLYWISLWVGQQSFSIHPPCRRVTKISNRLWAFWQLPKPLSQFCAWLNFNTMEKIRSVEANRLLPFTEFLIRKLAHFGVYFVLVILMFFALQKTTSLKLIFSLAFAWMLTVHFAIVDELNQSFTPERTPYYFDVAIDSVGALAGLLLCGLFVWWKERKGR